MERVYLAEYGVVRVPPNVLCLPGEPRSTGPYIVEKRDPHPSPGNTTVAFNNIRYMY